jgi:hypothetical protein
VENIFTIQNNQTKNKEGLACSFTLPYDFCEEFYTIREYDKKQLESLYEVVLQTQSEKINTVALILSPTPQGRRKNRNGNFPRRRDTKENVNSQTSSVNSNKITNANTCNDKSKDKDDINLKIEKSKEEESNLSEISLNSDKTDCEDIKCMQRQKISISPLGRSEIYSILSEYFLDIKTEDDFNENLSNGELFCFLDKNKNSKPVKNHYMRRRVCVKLFKVFERLVKISIK